MGNRKVLWTYLWIISTALWGCAASGPIYRELAAPVSDNALLYIYRPPRSVGSLGGGGPEMFVDGKSVGKLLNRGYVAIYLSPGVHQVTAKGNIWNYDYPEQRLDLEMIGGEVKYLRIFSSTGGASLGYLGQIKVHFKQHVEFVDPNLATSEIVDCYEIKK